VNDAELFGAWPLLQLPAIAFRNQPLTPLVSYISMKGHTLFEAGPTQVVGGIKTADDVPEIVTVVAGFKVT